MKRKARIAVVGRGEKGPLCDPGSELLLTGREGESNARTINGMTKKKKEEKITTTGVHDIFKEERMKKRNDRQAGRLHVASLASKTNRRQIVDEYEHSYSIDEMRLFGLLCFTSSINSSL